MRRRFEFQNLGVTNSRYAVALKEAAARVIDSGWYLHGAETAAFEKELASLSSTHTAVATDNGLNALRMIYHGYMQLGYLRPGDEVIMAANTFIATVLPATQLGLRVKFAEPDASTFGLDLRRAEQLVGEKTRMIVVTHLYGTPSWDFEAAERLRRRGIILVEDNAQALGASICGQPTGSLGHAAAISFYPGKNVGALGDGGAVVTSCEELAQTIRALANYGSARRYESELEGYNSRMDEIQAAFLRVKLADLAQISEARRQVAEAYHSAISNPAVVTPTVFNDRRQVWHQYVVRCAQRDELQQYLKDNGVETLIHYPIAPHKQKCYENLFGGLSLPLTEQLSREVLSLPIANITAADACEIAEILNGFKPQRTN